MLTRTLDKEQIIALSNIKKGDRILLVKMEDDKAPLPFTKGTVQVIDDNITIHTKWDDGSGLGLIPGLDAFYLIPKELAQLEEEYKSNPRFRIFFNKYMDDRKLNDWFSDLDFKYIGPQLLILDDLDIRVFANDFLIGEW